MSRCSPGVASSAASPPPLWSGSSCSKDPGDINGASGAENCLARASWLVACTRRSAQPSCFVRSAPPGPLLAAVFRSPSCRSHERARPKQQLEPVPWLVLRIGFAGRALASPAGGVRRYTRELSRALAALGGDRQIVAIGAPGHVALPAGVRAQPAAPSLPS